MRLNDRPDREQADDVEVMDPLARVFRYHQETKHHFFRYARALGYMDWANQPDPFRRYAGAPLVPLPILRPDEEPLSPPYADLYRPRAVLSHGLSIRTLSRFFEHALALTAWKQAGGARWALRSNPSSGNLHPTEGYLLIGTVPGLAPTPGLYHYAPREHALELRADCSQAVFSALMNEFPPEAFLVGWTSIHWREAWKYGERAFRYCQHDAGHAIGTARIAAATLGWKMVVLDGVGDDILAELLGLTRLEDFEGAEREHPDCVAVVWPDRAEPRGPLPLFLDKAVVRELTGHMWYGKANRLSPDDPVPWEIIDDVAAASWKATTDRRCVDFTADSSFPPRDELRVTRDGLKTTAGHIIRQRRSAVAFDGKTSIASARFFLMLTRVMPRVERRVSHRPMPWDAVPWAPAIHLAMFVHRVDGLPSGLYMLVRDPAKGDTLRRAMHGQFAWATPPGCPSDLPLFLLQEGDARELATQVSCHQEIAGDSAFSLGMIAEFETTLRIQGAWCYRRLFWETGLIGQVLYLEAEAAGVRATGIGCFFDDPMHDVLGLKGMEFQSLYHFTTGGPVDDPRLTTLPAYGQHDQ